jgi:hypothetical protein
MASPFEQHSPSVFIVMGPTSIYLPLMQKFGGVSGGKSSVTTGAPQKITGLPSATWI